jgi:thiol-disulfide isomerase/thioredoxin
VTHRYIVLKMKFLTLLFLVAASIAGKAQTTIIKIEDLEKLINNKTEKIQIINFWATWCGPCVKELPLFENFHAQKSEQTTVTLISLDYADNVKKVNAFIARKKLTAKVLLLDETDANAWIDKVETSWGGAIPATLIINTKTGRRKFVDKELHEGELEKLVAEIQQ